MTAAPQRRQPVRQAGGQGRGHHRGLGGEGGVDGGEEPVVSGWVIGDQRGHEARCLVVEERHRLGNVADDLVGVSCDFVHYSDTIPDCCSVNGNLCVDPAFEDPAALDYHLAAGSPCVDSGFDPTTFTVVSVVLAITALLAAVLPARRALVVYPIVVLRYE